MALQLLALADGFESMEVDDSVKDFMESIVQWADFNTKPSSLMNLTHDEDCSRMHIFWYLSLLVKLNKLSSQEAELICCSSVVKVPDNQKPICFDDAANHGGSEMKLINGGVRE